MGLKLSDCTVIPIHKKLASRRAEELAASKNKDQHRDTPRILIVEDDALNLRMLGDIIKSLGYEIVTTRSGQQAIDLAFIHLPDLVLLDMHLPDISGIKVCENLRHNPIFKNTPIVAVTALARAEDRQRAMNAGCTDYLVKPVSLDMLIKTVSSNLEKTTPPIYG